MAYRDVEVNIPAFSISALDGSEFYVHVSAPGVPGTHSRSERGGEEKQLCSSRESIPGRLIYWLGSSFKVSE
jgi:hypothetical protein